MTDTRTDKQTTERPGSSEYQRIQDWVLSMASLLEAVARHGRRQEDLK